MSEQPDVREGSCRCGRVHLRVSGAPLITMACHCRGCQRMTASAFSLSALFPAEAFEVTEGETGLGGLLSGARHHHCGFCKSWLFTRPEGMDAFVNVRSTMFDDPALAEPFAETQTAEKLPWATTPAVHSFERFPDEQDFGRLIAEYAASNARPSPLEGEGGRGADG